MRKRSNGPARRGPKNLAIAAALIGIHIVSFHSVGAQTNDPDVTQDTDPGMFNRTGNGHYQPRRAEVEQLEQAAHKGESKQQPAGQTSVDDLYRRVMQDSAPKP